MNAEDMERIQDVFRDIVKRDERSGTFECPAIRKDGTPIVVESSVSPVRDSRGHP